MHTADEQLHRLWITQRDAQAFRALTSRYCAMVYATCVRILRNPADAEDVTQECFIALARTPRGLSGPMGAWLHRVATYQALNRRRSESRRRVREERYAPQAAAEGRWEDIGPFVDEAIDQLPEKIRVAVVAHFVEDVSVTLIAQREGVTHGAISQRIRKGVELIRERLREKGVVVSITAFSALLAQNASAAPAPAALVSSLGKLALSGSGRAAVAAPPILGLKSLAVAASALIAAAALIGYAARPALITAAEPAPVAAIAPEPAPVEPAAPPPPEIAPAAVAAEPAAAIEPIVPAVPAPGTWQEVVTAYATHQNRIRRIAFDFEHAASGTYFYQSYAPRPGRREFFHRGAVVTDGERCSLRYRRWGDWFGGEPVTADDAQIGSHAYNGDTYINYLGTIKSPGFVQIHPAARGSMIKDSAFRDGRIYLLFARQPGGPLLGLPLDSGLRMEELIFGARSVQLRPDKEEVNGAACYVVDAHTAYGDFTVWFDPAKDYNVARSVIVQDGGDVYEGVRLVKGGRARYDYAAERFIEIDGLWVVAEASMRQSAALLQGNGHDYVHRLKRTNIRLLAQGSDDGAYVLRAEDIPNGATLMGEVGSRRKSGDPEWRWYNGEFVLTHENGSQRRPSGKGRGFGGGMIAN